MQHNILFRCWLAGCWLADLSQSKMNGNDDADTLRERILALERDVQRMRAKEQMVNEYAGSLAEKMAEKEALVFCSTA